VRAVHSRTAGYGWGSFLTAVQAELTRPMSRQHVRWSDVLRPNTLHDRRAGLVLDRLPNLKTGPWRKSFGSPFEGTAGPLSVETLMVNPGCLSRKSSILLRRIVSSMFMGVNSSCHHLRPALGALKRRRSPGQLSRLEQAVNSRRLRP
jgi:hypothetical protein